MSRKTLIAVAIAASCFLINAACGSSSSPSAPSTPPPTGTVTAVNISTASPSGTTFQLTAMAQLSDGSSRDVTSSAVWDSSNTGLATVSSGGLVTVKGTGAVDFTATYVKVSGSIHLLVSPQPATGVSALQGLVRDVPPGGNPIGGARVEIIAGPDTGKVATTDATGLYRFDSLTNARLSLHITANGFQEWAVGNLPLNDTVQTQDAWLYPVPPRDANNAPPTARCNDGSWTWDSDTAAGCSAHSGVAYTLAPGTDKPSSVRR
jgi:hypothetical protein